mmetsp:Transcript_83221/g.178409  ORF Transcript_83221/g.178409 Transcript_83221/m.178409 type:complete len:576 (-) Transcript_83221:100-1827(-)
MWDAMKVRLDLHGRIRVFLQTNLLRKYMNYCEASRMRVTEFDMHSAIMQDAESLAGGFVNFLSLIRIVGKFAVMLSFTIAKTPSALVHVLSMAVLMLILMGCKRCFAPDDGVTQRQKRAVNLLVSDACQKYRLIANYFQRPAINELFYTRVERLRISQISEKLCNVHSDYFFKWLGPGFVGMYLFLEGPAVISGNLQLGNFLASISIFKEISSDFAEGFNTLGGVAATVNPLRKFTTYLNLATDVLQWKKVNRLRREMTRVSRNEVMEAPPAADVQDGYRTDMISVKLTDVAFSYIPSQPVLRGVSVSLPQGQLVGVVGAHGSGKTTFMRVLAHEIFPTVGQVFIPTHLRILHVPQEHMFLNASPWRNLIFGCPDSNDVDPERVVAILREMKLGIVLELIREDLRRQHEQYTGEPDELGGYEDSDDNSSKDLSCSSCACCLTDLKAEDGSQEDTMDPLWCQRLSNAQLAKLHLARAFIMNPEVLVLQRPLMHFNEDESVEIMELMRQYVTNRGIFLPEGVRHLRRPRTCFFTAEHSRHKAQADVLWNLQPDGTIEAITKKGTASDKASRSSGGKA